MRREMLGRWVVPIRLIPLVLAIGYLNLLNGPYQPDFADWSMAVASTLLLLGGGRWPLAVVVLQAVLLAGVPYVRLGVGVVNMVSLFSLGELAWRRGGWRTWVGAGAVLFATLFKPLSADLVPELFRSILLVGAPVLLGLHMRSLQEIAWQAKERASADAQAARAEERTAVARELHDLVAHHVASMVLRIGVAQHVLKTDPKVAQVLREVHDSGTAAMADLRTLVSVLRDPDGEHDAVTDLPSALRAAVDRIEAAGPKVTADINPEVAGLDGVLRLAVLRVVQEGLTNVLKHAGTKAEVVLTVHRDDDAVVVTLTDDGPAAPANPGHGLIGMRERVELVGGSLRAGPTGRGWLVHARLPA